MRVIFDKLNDSYAKNYSLTKHLVPDEITVFFKGRVIFKQYIPKKHKSSTSYEILRDILTIGPCI
jgi:hypothetical protein